MRDIVNSKDVRAGELEKLAEKERAEVHQFEYPEYGSDGESDEDDGDA